MRILRVLLVCALLAGCGGDDEDQSAAPARSATPAAQNEEAAVREVFDSYMAALKAKDFDTACSKLAPETTAKLKENVKRLGVSDPPEECPEILGLVQDTAEKEEGGQKVLDELYDTAEVDSIKVSGADSAIINWHASVQGNRTPVSQSARKIDGEWKLVDVTN
jgi:hypothetical protein